MVGFCGQVQLWFSLSELSCSFFSGDADDYVTPLHFLCKGPQNRVDTTLLVIVVFRPYLTAIKDFAQVEAIAPRELSDSGFPRNEVPVNVV